MSKITMEQISVMNVQYWHYSFEYFLKSMEKCKLKNIELWAGAPHFYNGDYATIFERDRKIAEMKKQMDDLGMKVVILTPEQLNYPINVTSPDTRYRERSLDYLIEHMDIALNFGTDKVFLTPAWSLLDQPREDAWKRLVESFQILCEKAAKKGVTMVVEQLQPYEGILVNTREHVKQLLDEVNASNLEVCCDIVAMQVVGESLQDFYDVVPSEKITHIHWADGNPSGHYIWGHGNIPMMEYLKTLEKYQYSGYLSLEINDSIYWDDPHGSIDETAKYLRKFIPEK